MLGELHDVGDYKNTNHDVEAIMGYLKVPKKGEKLGMEKDQTFRLNCNMLNDILPYVYGYIAIRFNDFEAQWLITKMMFERIFTSHQSLYKHIFQSQLLELATWDAFDIQCFSRSPGANEVGGRFHLLGMKHMSELFLLALPSITHYTQLQQMLKSWQSRHLY